MGGLLVLDPWLTLFSGSLCFISKLRFADGMVWLYEDMKDSNPEYKKWVY